MGFSGFSFIYSTNTIPNYSLHLAFTYTCVPQGGKKRVSENAMESGALRCKIRENSQAIPAGNIYKSLIWQGGLLKSKKPSLHNIKH